MNEPTARHAGVVRLPVSHMRDALGRPLHDLRISVMDRCNFRCPYCMPEDKFHPGFGFLERSERLDFDEIVRLARLFAELGARKIRVTGGEPLLRSNLPELIADLGSIERIEEIALTTNGMLLSQQAARLAAAGLARVTVSLDALDETTFRALSGGRGGVARVLDGIEAAREAGLEPVKVNTVIERGINEHAIIDLVERFRGTGVIVRFIEYMDVGNINHWRRRDMMPAAELLDLINTRWPVTAVEPNYHGEVASRYRFDDGRGEIGFITSVSAPFCGACSRARLSSDGKLFTCLFASDGLDLRGPMRDGAGDDELLDLIARAWIVRRDRYSELRASLRDSDQRKVEMYYIGG